ncbi:MAG: D-alanyl-D-alanine carboxypeptidase [Lachnospiraceae bacterium]|nr:D-alanyl-D-alanine carboxypeptidase [Lachnospiraceae bacterium]
MVLSLLPIGTVFAEEEVNESELYAKAAVLMDAQSGRVLYSKNGEEVLPMASTTKIMTCILALEYGNMEDIVTVSSYAASQPKVHLGMITGREYYLKDLLYSLMLESHNDSAVAIAEQIGGSVEAFADMMNQKAAEIGCKQTYFITPNGLDAKVVMESGEEKFHSTTAEDLARIMSYCIMESPKKEEFLAITRTEQYSFSDIKGQCSYSCYNHNAFLTMMDGALSGKTGFTGLAGYCYVGALRREEKTFVIALLACGWPNNKTYKWSDSRKLFTYGMENYNYKEFYEEQVFEPLSVANGAARSGNPFETVVTGITIEEGDRSVGLLVKETEKVVKEVSLLSKLTAPVQKGDAVGTVRYYLESEGEERILLREYSVIAVEEVAARDFTYCFRYIVEEFLP